MFSKAHIMKALKSVMAKLSPQTCEAPLWGLGLPQCDLWQSWWCQLVPLHPAVQLGTAQLLNLLSTC